MADLNQWPDAMTAAAASGAAAAGLANRSADTWKRKLQDMAASALVGAWLGAPAADLAGLTEIHHRYGVACLVGASGSIILTTILDFVKSDRVTEWVKAKLGLPADPPKPPPAGAP